MNVLKLSPMSAQVIDRKIVVGPFQCNCHLLVCPVTGQGVLIDPGDESEKILKLIQDVEKTLSKPVQIVGLYHTHAHLDHIAATRGVKEALAKTSGSDPQIYLHRQDEFIYLNLKKQAEFFGLQYGDPLPVNQFFEDEQILKVGKLEFSVLHTPGHSPGGVCLKLKEDTELKLPPKLFTGDTLFQASIGRTDLWGGDLDILLKSIRNRLFTMEDEWTVYPGHGPETSIGVERRSNPFLT